MPPNCDHLPAGKDKTATLGEQEWTLNPLAPGVFYSPFPFELGLPATKPLPFNEWVSKLSWLNSARFGAIFHHGVFDLILNFSFPSLDGVSKNYRQVQVAWGIVALVPDFVIPLRGGWPGIDPPVPIEITAVLSLFDPLPPVKWRRAQTRGEMPKLLGPCEADW